MSATDATRKEGQELAAHLENLNESHADLALASIQPARGAPAGDHGFKAKYFQKTDHEKKVNLLQNYIKSLGPTLGPAATIAYDPTKDIDLLLQRDKELELYQFDNFIQQVFNIFEPSHQRIIRELEPEFYERRWDEIERQINIEKEIAKIKLFGVQTKEDLMFIYALGSGRIKPPSKLAFDTTKNEPTYEHIKKGLLNPRRFIGPVDAPNTGIPMIGMDGNVAKQKTQNLTSDWWGGPNPNENTRVKMFDTLFKR